MEYLQTLPALDPRLEEHFNECVTMCHGRDYSDFQIDDWDFVIAGFTPADSVVTAKRLYVCCCESGGVRPVGMARGRDKAVGIGIKSANPEHIELFKARAREMFGSDRLEVRVIL